MSKSIVEPWWTERIATLDATVATLDRIGMGYRARVKELEGELAECQRLSKLHLQARIHPEKHE